MQRLLSLERLCNICDLLRRLRSLQMSDPLNHMYLKCTTKKRGMLPKCRLMNPTDLSEFDNNPLEKKDLLCHVLWLC